MCCSVGRIWNRFEMEPGFPRRAADADVTMLCDRFVSVRQLSREMLVGGWCYEEPINNRSDSSFSATPDMPRVRMARSRCTSLKPASA